MGLFGVVSATVTRRKHEIAVRLALGADHGRVLRLVLIDGALLILMGVIGIPATWLAGRALQGLLVGVSPTDPVTLGTVAVGLGAVALDACYLPAGRCWGSSRPGRSGRSEALPGDPGILSPRRDVGSSVTGGLADPHIYNVEFPP